MSYQRPDTGNSMNDLFTTLSNFTAFLPKLEEARTPQDFELWLDRLIEIDRRSAVLYFRKNRDRFPPDYMALVEARLGEWL